MSGEKTSSNFTLFSESNNVDQPMTDRISNSVWLISLGVIFLLNTSGILPWSVWITFGLLCARLWPLFIIGAGISVLVGSSRIAKIISDVIWFLVFATIFAVAVMRPIDTDPKTYLQETFPAGLIQEISKDNN